MASKDPLANSVGGHAGQRLPAEGQKDEIGLPAPVLAGVSLLVGGGGPIGRGSSRHASKEGARRVLCKGAVYILYPVDVPEQLLRRPPDRSIARFA